MIWIKTRSLADNDNHLQECIQECMNVYPPEYAQPVDALSQHEQGGEAPSVIMAHSLLPETLKHSFSTYGTLLSPDLPLSRRHHEMIAATVSALNDCFY